jgi:hypothetical protein
LRVSIHAVELGNQQEELTGGGVDVSGELSEAVAQIFGGQIVDIGAGVEHEILPVYILSIMPVYVEQVREKKKLQWIRYVVTHSAETTNIVPGRWPESTQAV